MNDKVILKELRSKAMEAFKNAYSPYSKACVGSAVMMDSGKIYSGCNVENGSYGATVCAERIAIFSAVSQGERKIKFVYVYTIDGWPPCGMCRQVIKEFCSSETKIIIGNAKGEESTYLMEEIYPVSFGIEHLKI